MNPEDQLVFTTRKAHPDHERIFAETSNKPVGEFKELVQMCFRHMQCPFLRQMEFNNLIQELDADLRADPDKKLPKLKRQEITRRVLSYLFYKKHYNHEAVRLKVTGSTSGEEITIGEFFQGILGNFRTSSRQLFYLTGQVGSGKTTLINYILTEKMLPLFYSGTEGTNHRAWFLRYDLEMEGGRDMTGYHDIFIAKLVLKAVKVAENRFNEDEIKKRCKILEEAAGMLLLLRSEGSPADIIAKACFTCLDGLKELIIDIKCRKGMSFLLVIDNCDYVIHLHERTTFHIENNRHETGKKILEEYQCFIKMILGFIYNRLKNISMIIVARTENFDVLHKEPISCSYTEDHHNNGRIRLEIKDATPKEVIDSRFKLLEDAVETLPYITDKPGKKKEFETYTEALSESLYAEHKTSQGVLVEPLVNQLLKLSNNKYRNVVEFLSSYTYIEEGGALGVESIALMVFILDRHLLFTQKETHFPNMFLARIIENHGDSADPEAHKHPHSYWLKILLLNMILKAKKDRTTIDRNRILEILCAEGRSDWEKNSAYPSHLVCECLGSLLEAGASNLVSIKLDHNYDPRKIRLSDISLTPRASYCLWTNPMLKHLPHFDATLFDHFYYMQLVVDDYDLPIPAIVLDHFSFEKIGNYQYLTESIGQSDATHLMVKAKSERVALLIEILGHYLKVEEGRFKTAFKNLREIGVPIPDIDKIRENFYAEIGSVYQHLKISDKSTEDVRKFAERHGTFVRLVFEQYYEKYLNIKQKKK